MKVKKLKLQICLLAVVSLAFFSCQNNQSGTSSSKDADSLAKASSQPAAAKPGEDTENYSLPSPLQLASIMVKSAGFKYMPDICSPIKNGAQFNSHYQMALNLGIYSTDLSYCLINKKNDDGSKYLNEVKILSDQLGFGEIFKSNSLVTRFQNNIDIPDSVASLIGELQMGIDTYLEENNQKYINSIAFSGALVESMYIGGSVYEKTKNPGEGSCITEQMDIMDGLIKLLTKNQSFDNNIPGLITQLKGISSMYNSFDEVKTKSDNKPLILTPDHISQINKAITDLRGKFIAS
jgi:hypothetical protein